jgi:hypothetical protein
VLAFSQALSRSSRSRSTARAAGFDAEQKPVAQVAEGGPFGDGCAAGDGGGDVGELPSRVVVDGADAAQLGVDRRTAAGV